jgi:hypothetical protein
MLQRKELEQLRRQKEQLVLQSDAHRQRLQNDWQRLQSPEAWLDEILGLARRHPVWLAGLTAATGTLVVKTLSKPGMIINGISRIGNVIPVAFAVWRLLSRKWRQPPSDP